jgi:hypothetical protein
MFSKFFRRRIANVNTLFNAQYIDPKGLFVCTFNEVPSAAFITDVNVNDAYPFLRKMLSGLINATYQHSHYNYDTRKLEFNVTFLVLNDNRLIEVGGDYVGIYYGKLNYNGVEALVKELAAFCT